MAIVHGAIIQESNTFSPVKCTLDHFRASYLYYGDEVFRLSTTGTETAGVLAVAREAGVEVLPTIAAHSVSYGPLEKDCYRHLREELLGRLRRIRDEQHIDGVVINLHGSMVAEGEPDPEGDLLVAVRQIIGPDTPLVATFDLHAHITERMVQAADAIIGYQRYPHDDVYETGQRGMRLLLGIARREIRPTMAMARIPVLVPATNGLTAFGPLSLIRAEARRLEAAGEALHVSYFPVHPWNDLPEMGVSMVSVTDNDLPRAKEQVTALARMAWDLVEEFDVKTLKAEDAIRRALAIEGGPIVLCDTADSPGGGATGDGTAALEAALRLNVQERTLLSVVDPEAVSACMRAGVGNSVRVSVGNKIDPTRGQPVPVAGKVKALTDGTFQYKAGLLKGVIGNMGPSAVLEVGHISILLASQSTYEWADDQYRSVGLDPTRAKIVIVKMPVNFRLSYDGIMKGYFILDTPGPCGADLRRYNYQQVTRPIYPLDPKGAFRHTLFPRD